MSAPRNEPIRLNDIQSIMRSWSELAPYQFIHAMQIDGSADVCRWRLAAEQAVQELGLGAPDFLGNTVRFSQAPSVRIDLPEIDLDQHVDAEMNRSFSRDELPVRFFVIEQPGNSHWFGVVVDHWLADDYSCRQLLHGIFLRYHSSESENRFTSPRQCISPPLRQPGFAGLRHLVKQVAIHRRAFRLPLGDALDFRVRTFRRTLPDGFIDTLRLLAKERAATVHDLFLVGCVQAFGEFRKAQFDGKRQGIGLVTAMDLRRFEGSGEGETAFGCALGYFFVVVFQPEASASGSLIRDMASKTRLLKASNRAGLGELKWVQALLAVSRSPRARATLFHRGVPQVCGISNVNLTGSWVEEARPRLLDYRRIGPTGPIVPMLFMITTIGSRLSIDVTYRTAAFTRHHAEFLTDRFIMRLSSLAA